jgi:hypothetical protein
MKHPPTQRDQLPAAGGVGGKREDDFVDHEITCRDWWEFMVNCRSLMIILTEKVFRSVRGTLQESDKNSHAPIAFLVVLQKAMYNPENETIPVIAQA